MCYFNIVLWLFRYGEANRSEIVKIICYSQIPRVHTTSCPPRPPSQRSTRLGSGGRQREGGWLRAGLLTGVSLGGMGTEGYARRGQTRVISAGSGTECQRAQRREMQGASLWGWGPSHPGFTLPSPRESQKTSCRAHTRALAHLVWTTAWVLGIFQVPPRC